MPTIIKETLDPLNATIRINISNQDYEPVVNDSLKKLSKKADVKGFRKGMVPVGHIKKLYGNEILADELNKIINQELTKYLDENKIEILGSPLPRPDDENTQLNIYETKEYVFAYDLGLYPEFELSLLSSNTSIDQYVVKAHEQAIQKEIERIQKRYGQMTNPEDGVAKGDVLFVKFTELDESGNVKEGGVENATPVNLEQFQEQLASDWLGKKPSDFFDVEIKKALLADAEDILHNFLNVKGHPPISEKFRITLEKINRNIPAELNQELFDKLFGEGKVQTPEALKEEVKKMIEDAYVKESNYLLNNHIVKYFLENTQFELPHDFLKRWIKVSNEQPVTDEQVEHDYDGFAKNLKWTIIVNKIRKENNIEVKPEDIKAQTLEVIRGYYGFPDNEESNKILSSLADEMMKKEDHIKRTYEELADKMALDFIKSKITLNPKEISVEEFADLIK